MCDKISIKDLEVFAHHGVHPEEKVLGQKFIISIDLYADLSKAGRNDNLDDTVSYSDICKMSVNFMKEHTFKLIETAADSLAAEILKNFPKVKEVEVEVKKPWAPVKLHIDTVSVRLKRGWHKTFIALGSNMGDKEKYLTDAIEDLKADSDFRLIKVSDWIRTEPYGGVEQDDFLNGVAEFDTILSPQDLLEKLHEVESKAERVRDIRWGPRTLDLDILFYDDEIIDTEDLHIPHIDMKNRDFVLGPLNEIAPYKRHPIFMKTVNEMYNDLMRLDK